ncbi:primosomal protein N' [Crenobacter cavernae]|uniref:Replication restart protein PriA n=1 Tax=Crenobacter cavernae TaxID=2290923 RepID=A0ABY0FED6_9NEIS|nr:primosomal protein N' [Crenobacter cavernae]RXZ43320.1 primosomal protein N' [Crenobacter cavernae]
MPSEYRVEVALDVPLPATFTYLAAAALPVGARVAVPFGTRRLAGVVTGPGDESADTAKLKAVDALLDDLPPLPASWLELVSFTAAYYHAPIGQVAATALPTALRGAAPVRLNDTRPWRLSSAGRLAEPPAARAKAQRALWQALSCGVLSKDAARAIAGQAGKLLAEWDAAGWLERVDTCWRDAPVAAGPELTAAQAAALAELRGTDGFAAWLLFGVTGSGKTEVYLRLIADTLAEGRQALVLIPEINLTPQLLSRFAARFPSTPIAALHSSLSDGERLNAWVDAWQGRAGIVIGTRLSVFTPLPRLGLVIVDEEHDASFKQQDGVRYHARDLAVWRALKARVPVVLGSATPSLETLYRVETGRYRQILLAERAHASASLPAVRILDVRRQRLAEGLSEMVVDALKAAKRRGELSLVFINRRGFSPVLSCGDCGWTSGCRHCHAKMVLHLSERRLRCHHCGAFEPVPHACPSCGNVDLKPVGHGTQRIEEALARMVPDARVLRIDRDSTSRKAAWDEIYRKVHAGEVDILVGTQMLAKGHDFPALSRVIVVNADAGLYSADYRATERLFSVLTQVAGRAGRADAPGEVLVQTQWPDHPLFAALVAHDTLGYAKTLLAERRIAALPPITHQAILRADAPDIRDANAFLESVRDTLAPPKGVTVLGPVPALMARLAGRERAQLIIESPQRAPLHAFLDAWRPDLDAAARRAGRSLRWSLDVDPQEL